MTDNRDEAGDRGSLEQELLQLIITRDCILRDLRDALDAVERTLWQRFRTTTDVHTRRKLERALGIVA